MPINQPEKIIQIGSMTLYSAEYLAEKLALTLHTVCAKLRSGEISGRKIGGKWFVSEQALKDYFEKH